MLKDTINQTIQTCLQILLAMTRYGKRSVWCLTFINKKTLCTIVAFSFCVTAVLNFESGMLSCGSIFVLHMFCMCLMGWGYFGGVFIMHLFDFLTIQWNSIIFHEKIMLEINKIYKGIGMMTIMYLLKSTIINYFLGLGYLIELYISWVN